jgi:hypothetical protein
VNVRQLSDKELIELAKQLHEAIHVFDCYGVDDLMLYNAVLEELRRRGYSIRVATELVVEKAEEEGESQ